VNDNVLDMQVHPGAAAGDRTTVGVRPQTAYFDVVDEVVTIGAGGDASVTATLGADNRIVLRGALPTDAATYNIATFAPDPAAYARALFIEALQKAGITVTTPLTAATGTLPAENSYTAPNKVAALKSPPTSILSKLVLKVSHNRGAESVMCLLAVKAGSKDCDAGLKTMIDTIGTAGVDQRSVLIYDGEGSDPASATPAALLRWLTWADSQPWSETYRLGLPDLNDDGKILAKSGTSARPENPPMPSLFVVQGEAGYMTTASGKHVVMAVYASNATYPTVAEGLAKGANAVKAVTSAMQSAG
jgi:D-alanyl-D-alanine carboxypeptidase/D-alanyl-D-alanine-endopeptidase (penicillin-binding protein 4)